MMWPWQRPAPDAPNVLRLRPPNGFGDHLMLSAVIEGLKAERPELRIRVAACHPEIFAHNPHVEELLYEGRMKKWRPADLERFERIHFRSPEERYLQISGHLIDDMYQKVGIPLQQRPRQPRIYLTPREERYQAAELDALPRPRIAVVPFGKSTVRLPNKIYPADQWRELTRLLRGLGGSLLHLGSCQEGDLAEGARDFRDIGYRHTAAVLRKSDLLVTHVSGIMHLAAAVRTPAVVLYGAAEHPAISGYPWNRNLYVPIDCGPCWMETPCSHHSCMRQLTPERALAEIEAALASVAVPDDRR
jgi:ADP-heptose:LPS heptosyltransferase